jgi:hypothetical protein
VRPDDVIGALAFMFAPPGIFHGLMKRIYKISAVMEIIDIL